MSSGTHCLHRVHCIAIPEVQLVSAFLIVLSEPMLTAVAMRVLTVLLTNTALLDFIVWPVVLMEPMLTTMRVPRLVLLEPMLTAVAIHAKPVMAEPLLTVLAMRVSRIVLVEPLLTIVHGRAAPVVLLLEPMLTAVAMRAKHVLLEPMMTAVAMCVLSVLLMNTALRTKTCVHPFVVEHMLTAVHGRVSPVVLPTFTTDRVSRLVLITQ